MARRMRYCREIMTLEIAVFPLQIAPDGRLLGGGPMDYRVFGIAGRRFAVLNRFHVTATGERGVPFDAELTIALQGGRFVCTDLAVRQSADGEPITLVRLRTIPVESIVRRSVRKGRVIELNPPDGVPKLRLGGPLGLPVAPRRPRGKRRGPDDDVDLAAIVHVLAQVLGAPPTKAVADQLRIPLGTARDLVARARERLYLKPPAELMRAPTFAEAASEDLMGSAGPQHERAALHRRRDDHAAP
jgi:hypothetical protein